MASYLVFARKYRPQTFDDVVGQDHVCTTLKNALTEKRVAHAYMFVGPKGTGKTSVARILAKALNCEHGPTPEPCGVCPLCVDIASGNDIDVIEIDGASNRGIDDIKELRENVKFAPGRARYKIYIIDEVHMLSNDANNALLKTLEEPPEHVKFIFATTEPHSVIPTVFSRCQRFDFRMIPLESIAERLNQICAKEGIAADSEVILEIARAAGGGMRDAQSILDQVVSYGIENISAKEIREIIGSLDPEVIRDLTEALLTRDNQRALEGLNEILNSGTNINELVTGILAFIRNTLVYSLCGNDPALVPGITEKESSTFDLILETNSVDRLLLVTKMLEDFLLKSRNVTSRRVLLEIACINILRLDNMVSISELIQGAEQLPDNDIKREGGAGTRRSRPDREGPTRAAASPEKTAASEPEQPRQKKTPQGDLAFLRFMQGLTERDGILGAVLNSAGITVAYKDDSVLIDTESPDTLADTVDVFTAHDHWKDLIEDTARQFFGKNTTVRLLFMKKTEKELRPEPEKPPVEEYDFPKYDESDFETLRDETVKEKADRIRRYEPIVDKIINVFNGRVLNVQEK